MRPDIGILLAFLPLGLPLLMKKITGNTFILYTFGFLSYGSFVILIISIFMTRERVRFIKILLLLLGLLIINFAGCRSMGQFIDG